MRALLFAAACACTTAACAPPGAAPYRFSNPMLGQADVPLAELPAPPRKPNAAPARVASSSSASSSPAKPRARYAYGWQTDAQAGIRVASAKGIELTVPDASAVSADAVGAGVVYSRLPAPNKPGPTGITAPLELPGMAHIREPGELRAWVGRRDTRDPLEITLAWLEDLGLATDELLAVGDGAELVTWAQAHGALLPASHATTPGDLLVFSRAVDHADADLIAIVIGRDARGVTEFAYAGGGVIRRGFVDIAHPTARRGLDGGVLNTFLRHRKQLPPKGTRYLSGELLAHVIRVR